MFEFLIRFFFDFISFGGKKKDMPLKDSFVMGRLTPIVSTLHMNSVMNTAQSNHAFCLLFIAAVYFPII